MVQSARPLRRLTSPDETGTATADFSPMMAPGVTIFSATVAMTVVPQNGYPLTDAAPQSRVLRGPFIVQSPSDGSADRAVAARIGTFLPDVCYVVNFLASASDGTEPELWQYWVADYPGSPPMSS